ncbi:isopentenyl phosphate kinase [Patescibacteria group bacterium]|nr:isopentenyl phosphate kinase [Patescibacteria group bacterium]
MTQTKKTPIVFVKIGGSLITDKTKPFSLKEHALDTICEEIKKATLTGKKLVVGHGAGSFAHFPAKKYQTHKGIINDASYRGIAEVADVAAQLNRIVVKKLLEKGVNAVSVSPLSTMVARNHSLKSVFSESIEALLRLNLLPVLYGDQIIDTQVGCTIFSTEKVLGYLALHLKKKGYVIERIIHCGQTNGVYDADGRTIPEITTENFPVYQSVLTGSSGTDVTGGMIHKVEETLALAREGIPGLIIDGIEHGSLSKAVRGEPVLGTRVER